MAGSRDKILVGDVGGTNVRLGIALRGEDGTINVTNIHKTPSDQLPSLEAAIAEYLRPLPEKPKRAALAIAGPIKNGCVTLTNRNWTVSQTGLQQEFSFAKVSLYNDFAAMARAVPECSNTDFKTLNDGTPDPKAPILVAGPGTGFGVAILVPTQCNETNSWKVISTEGGHQAYAPQTKMETDILHILQEKYDFVSLELVSSGSGMDAVHQAICKRLGETYTQIAPEIIREKALTGDRACLDVCEIRAHAIMGALGDMALATGARGGVVLAGGVAKRLLDFIDTPSAMARYTNRGPKKQYVKNISVKLLQKPAAALYGVAALTMDEDNG